MIKKYCLAVKVYLPSMYIQTVDSLATAVMSYIAAIPLTIMVEMPMVRFINVLVFKPLSTKEVKQS